MKKTALFLYLILLSGCTFYNPFSPADIDKVTIVRYTPYLYEHRAFIDRTHLKTIKNGKKYLYLYKKSSKDIAVLTQRKNTFFLYTLSDPKEKIYTLLTFKKENLAYALKHFKSMGYRPLSSPLKKGFIIKVSHKRYKNIKTLLFEIKDYTRLVKLYQKAIANYHANSIKNIKTPLPKALIIDYYRRYAKQTKDPKKLKQLQIIADKLQIKGPKITKQVSQNPSAVSKESQKKEEKSLSLKKKPKKKEKSPSWYDFVINNSKPQKPALPYSYYLHQASLKELHAYLLEEETKKLLSSSEYLALKQREKNMQNQKLLNEGTLEELIAAYKLNKDKRFKQRIFTLMKEQRKKEEINKQ